MRFKPGPVAGFFLVQIVTIRPALRLCLHGRAIPPRFAAPRPNPTALPGCTASPCRGTVPLGPTPTPDGGRLEASPRMARCPTQRRNAPGVPPPRGARFPLPKSMPGAAGAHTNSTAHTRHCVSGRGKPLDGGEETKPKTKNQTVNSKQLAAIPRLAGTLVAPDAKWRYVKSATGMAVKQTTDLLTQLTLTSQTLVMRPSLRRKYRFPAPRRVRPTARVVLH